MVPSVHQIGPEFRFLKILKKKFATGLAYLGLAPVAYYIKRISAYFTLQQAHGSKF